MFSSMVNPRLEQESQRRPARLSFSSRMSRAWKRDTATTAWTDQSHQGSTFVVPLFFSTPANQRENEDASTTTDLRSQRSRTSVRSMMDPEGWPQQHMSPSVTDGFNADEASRYSIASQYNPVLPVLHAPSPPIPEESHNRERRRVSSAHMDSTIRSQSSTKSPWKRRQVRVKVRLSLAFGVTLLATIILYIALAASRTGSGTMFHVLSVLTIMCFAGVFAHALIRMIMLVMNPPKPKKRARRTHRAHRSISGEQVHVRDGIPPKKPVAVAMVDDEEKGDLGPDFEVSRATTIRAPPPVYGNFRSSTRMDPGYVHWAKVPPTPLTPTYDEAVGDNRHMPSDTCPPNYVVQGGVTPMIAVQTRDVEAALASIHPLERSRMARLTGC